MKHRLHPQAVFQFFGALLAPATLLAQGEPAAAPTPPPVPPGIIYEAKVEAGDPQPSIQRMVDALVCAVAQQKEIGAAWARWIKPGDRVGIKVDAEGAPQFATHPAIVAAIIAGLEKAGVPRTNIVIWDRDADKVALAGYPSSEKNGPRLAGSAAMGYEMQNPFTAAVLGKLIWGDVQFKATVVSIPGKDAVEPVSEFSYVSRILAKVDKIINVPLLKSSETCAVVGALYNASVPNVDNWRRLAADPGSDPGIPELYLDERIGPKVVFHLMDGLDAQYAGGPGYSPDHVTAAGSLFASHDPVALDVNALRLIEAWRVSAKLPPVGKFAGYLQSAQAYQIGNAEDFQVRPVLGSERAVLARE